MPQWAGSSWYFLRYVDNHNDKELVSREKADNYLPVDMYIGGVEHAVLHLLYSRFYTKFLYDIGVIDFDEPFHKLFNQGMITGKNGIKMSKSKGNVVSPDDLVSDYGCDSLRMYELFVGPPELDAEWDDEESTALTGFLNRFWNLVHGQQGQDIKATKEMIKLRHRLVYDITTRLESFSLNTVISGFMEYNNKLIEIAKKEGGMDKETLETMAVLLAPFAPHIAEEIWEQLGHTDSVFHAGWPTYDEEAMKDDEIEIAGTDQRQDQGRDLHSGGHLQGRRHRGRKRSRSRQTDRNDCQRNLCSGEDHKYCAKIIEKKFSELNKVLGNVEKFV